MSDIPYLISQYLGKFFCASPLAPFALALTVLLDYICAAVLGYFKVYICILLPIIGQRNLLMISCHNYAHQLANTRHIISKIRDYYLGMHTLLVLPCCYI